jgi:hypothetical protein
MLTRLLLQTRGVRSVRALRLLMNCPAEPIAESNQGIVVSQPEWNFAGL